MLRLAAVAIALASAAACSKKAPPKAEPPKLEWKKVPSMGIEVEVAPGSDVQDNTSSSGFPASTIYSTDGTPTTFIFGAKDLADSLAIPADFDAAKARVQKEHPGFKLFTVETKSDTGFELRYTGASLTDPNAQLLGVTLTSKVAGLTVDCQTNASTIQEIEATVKLCKSIRAAK